jgi:hypothetical protein
MTSKFSVGDIVIHRATKEPLIILSVEEYGNALTSKEFRYVVRVPGNYLMARDIREYELEVAVKDDTPQ